MQNNHAAADREEKGRFALMKNIFNSFSRALFGSRDKKEEMVNTLGDLLEEKDEYTYEHTLRVADFVKMIAEELNLSSDETERCVKVGKLHDIGKIIVRDAVLKKEGKLSPEEYQEIKQHVSRIPELFPDNHSLAQIFHLAMYHHEWYNGKGYPFGAKGDEIPLEARVVAVADAWDAMTSRRVYRSSFSHEKALRIMRENSGIQWDPTVVEAFFRVYEKHLCQQAS
jgi:HD-GYP domain-containing protein (c-di-GMP phosphodiesterase class II)